MSEKFAYVTLLSTDNYLLGVLALNKSLKSVRSLYPLVVVCSDCISDRTMQILSKYEIVTIKLNVHVKVDTERYNIALGYEHWNHTLDKLFVFNMTQYDKLVFLDSDMMVIRNIDHLFYYPHMSAVIADVFNEPDLKEMNSGLMVIRPSRSDFYGMLDLWNSGKIELSNVGDQDVIRAWFKDWKDDSALCLPNGYNVFYTDCYKLVKKQQVEPVYVIHYIGARKPWQVSLLAIYKRGKSNFLRKYFWKYCCWIMFLKGQLFFL